LFLVRLAELLTLGYNILMAEDNLLSDKDLDRGYWWLTHKTLIIKMSWFLGILLVVLLYVFLLTKFTTLINGAGLNQWAQNIQQHFDWQTYHQQRKPQTIVVSSAQVLPVAGRLYNLVAVVKNPNADWAISKLSYRFVVNGEAQEEQVTFLNPGQEKYLLKLGLSFQGVIKTVDLQIVDIAWRRFEEDTIVLDWQVDNIKYQGPSVITVDKERVDVPARATWQAQNLSLYNLWQTNWQVALYNLDRLVAVSQIQVENWQALAKKDLEAVWLNDLSNVTKVEVKPDVNWLDATNLKIDTSVPVEDDRFSL
jgi:hypothetical protein